MTGAQIAAELADRQPKIVTGDLWRTIDRHELRAGADAGRPRVKLNTRRAMLDLGYPA